MPTGLAGASRTRRIAFALALNLLLVAGEVVGALAAHSSALLADSGHNLADVAALGLALVAVRLTLRSPTASRSFGYHRATILSALANVGFLLVVTVLVAVQAAVRLAHPESVDGRLVLLVAGAATLVNGLAALVLLDRSSDLNMRSAMLHLGADALASSGVAIAGLIEWASGGLNELDPAVSLGIAVLIAWEAIHLGRASVEVLLESTPVDVDLAALTSAMSTVPGVEGIHDLHCWSLSSEVRALSAHVLLDGHPSLEDARVVGEAVKGVIGNRFSISHATLELECEPCAEGAEPICTIYPAATVLAGGLPTRTTRP